MNKAHRDRIAFMRICSGKFEAGMEVLHVQDNKKIRLSQPQQMMAQDRKIVEEAYAGDIIGLFDPGIFSIGDTVCMPGRRIQYEGDPYVRAGTFRPGAPGGYHEKKTVCEGYRTDSPGRRDPRYFRNTIPVWREIIVGVVGVLQFDVLKYRLNHEYNVEILLENLPYEHIRWIENPQIDLDKINGTSDMKKIRDLKGTSAAFVDQQLEHRHDAGPQPRS